MVSSQSIPWARRSSRDFPTKRWLKQRYPFPVFFAPFRVVAARPAGWTTSAPRSFPAQVWPAKQASAHPIGN